MSDDVDQVLKQFGALPYRTDAEGALSVLLITSRVTRRWIIPKGNPMDGLSPCETAAQEAFEEAGVSGAIDPRPLGMFSYIKRRKDGRIQRARVETFSLAVEATASTWPEQFERQFRWCAPDEAVTLVDDESLRVLIQDFNRRFLQAA